MTVKKVDYFDVKVPRNRAERRAAGDRSTRRPTDYYPPPKVRPRREPAPTDIMMLDRPDFGPADRGVDVQLDD